MAGIIDRLPILLEERLDFFPLLRANMGDAEKDRKGSASTSVADSLRFLGVAGFVVDHEVAGFRAYLVESGTIEETLFKRFENGEPISESYVSMLTYKALFNALAAGDMDLAKSLASHMGGRDAIEKEHDHPFDYTLGYALKWFVLDDRGEMQRWAREFGTTCQQKDNADFQGYAQVFDAILAADTAMANEGLKALVEGHKRQSKGTGVFKDSADEVLCVWGLGMANLARWRGLAVQAVPPLIPEDLLLAS